MLMRVFKKLGYSMVLLRVGGLKACFQQLRRQIFSRETFIGLERGLDTNSVPVECGVQYNLRLATGEDMEEILQQAKWESKEMAHKLVYRKWFYESGFRNCYVARTADTGELCSMAWIIFPRDDHVGRGFKNLARRLNEDECLLENAYTFEKYRGNRLDPSLMGELSKIASGKGFQRAIVYVEQGNKPSLRSCERAGFKKFEEVPELRLLFFTRRKHSQGFLSE